MPDGILHQLRRGFRSKRLHDFVFVGLGRPTGDIKQISHFFHRAAFGN
jgi:hypothetical protein